MFTGRLQCGQAARLCAGCAAWQAERTACWVKARAPAPADCDSCASLPCCARRLILSSRCAARQGIQRSAATQCASRQVQCSAECLTRQRPRRCLTRCLTRTRDPRNIWRGQQLLIAPRAGRLGCSAGSGYSRLAG